MRLELLLVFFVLAVLLSLYVVIEISFGELSESFDFSSDPKKQTWEQTPACSHVLFEFFKRSDAGQENVGEHILSYIKCARGSTLNSSTILALKKQIDLQGLSVVKSAPDYNVQEYKTPAVVDWYDNERYDESNSVLSKDWRLKSWKKSFSNQEHQALMNLFRMLTELFAKFEIEYMLTEGSLMGSMRHFDQIPWDDDADILVHDKYRRELGRLIKRQNMFSDFDSAPRGKILKVFSDKSVNAGKYKWKFPFIDIFFYQENKTHIDRYFRDKKVFTPKKHVFPLKLRPFGKYWLPTPNDPLMYLERLNYVDFYQDCIRSTWNHRLEVGQSSDSIQCSALKNIYPLVDRDCLKLVDGQKFCTENLIFNHQKLVVLINYSGKHLVINLNLHD